MYTYIYIKIHPQFKHLDICVYAYIYMDIYTYIHIYVYIYMHEMDNPMGQAIHVTYGFGVCV